MARRGKGEGTVRKRPDGRWEARIALGFSDGKKRFRYLYGKTRREVQEQLVETQHAVQHGSGPGNAPRWTVAQYLTHWLDNVVKTRVKERTWIGYGQEIRRYLIPHLGPVALSQLNPQHVQAMNGRLLERVSPRTVHHAHTLLKNALNQAVRTGLLMRNVATLVDSPRVPRYEIAPLSLGQVRSLLMAAQGDPFECLYVLAICTGLRQGELFGLRWADINLELGRINVRSSLMLGKGSWQLTEPKSARSRRSVSLPPQAVAALKDHRRRQLEDRMAAEQWQEHDLVFCSRMGTPLWAANMQVRSFKPLLKKAGLPDIRFHDLRHTAASLLLWEGEHPKVVQELLGHSSIALTLDTYSHLIEGMQQSVADKMARILGGPSIAPG